MSIRTRAGTSCAETLDAIRRSSPRTGRSTPTNVRIGHLRLQNAGSGDGRSYITKLAAGLSGDGRVHADLIPTDRLLRYNPPSHYGGTRHPPPEGSQEGPRVPDRLPRRRACPGARRCGPRSEETG